MNHFKSFVRPILDYGDIIYDKSHKVFFIEKVERVQHDSFLVTAVAFKGTSRERLYKELGLKSVKNKRWHRKLCFLYKIVKGLSPKYLTPHQSNLPNQTHSKEYCKTDCVKNS